MAHHPLTVPNEVATIAAAVQTAQSYMLAGDPPAEAIQAAAEEAGLRFELLARRFELACGTPAEWLMKVRAMAPAAAAAVATNDAEDEVRRAALQFQRDAEKRDLRIQAEASHDRESFFKAERKALRHCLQSGEITRDEALEWAAAALARRRRPPGATT